MGICGLNMTYILNSDTTVSVLMTDLRGQVKNNEASPETYITAIYFALVCYQAGAYTFSGIFSSTFGHRWSYRLKSKV